MATQRNRYVKVALFEPAATNLMGGTVVGQYGDTLLVERPAPKPRAATPTRTRKPRTNAKAAAAPTAVGPLGTNVKEASNG
jgi:class 3 adenylate cyclase